MATSRSDTHSEQDSGESTKTAGLAAYGLFFTGLFLILVSVIASEILHWPSWAATFIRDVGLLLSAVMAGSLLHEKLLRDQTTKTVISHLEKTLDERVPSLDAMAAKLADTLDRRFAEFEESYGAKALAIRLVARERVGYDAYHHWMVHQAPEDLCFAGHSVLHRVQIDMDRRTLGPLESKIASKILGGSNIQIMFLDPRWDFVSRIATGEGQTYRKMMSDLAVTLGICRKLWEELRKQTGHVAGRVEVRLCREIQQYAYHYVRDRETGTKTILVGLYFANSQGMNSPLFSVEHKIMQEQFETHFGAIWSRRASGTDSGSTTLLDYAPPVTGFDTDVLMECRATLLEAGVPDSLVEDQLPGSWRA